jgi:hypothetical protein
MKDRLFAGCALTIAAGACSGAALPPRDVVGYTAAIKTPPPTTMSAGSPVPVVFTVTEHESDGSSQPAVGKSFTVAVTAGGGSVNGAASTTITTAADGSDSVVWVLGSTAGTQTVRGSLSSTQYLDVNVATIPLPTLRVTNGTCVGGHCDSLVVLAFPNNQPHTPGGNWSIQLGIVTGPQACFTLPPSATFTIYAPSSTTVFTWTPAVLVSLGLIPAEGRLFASPSTPEFASVTGAGWHVTLPGNQVTPDAACAP